MDGPYLREALILWIIKGASLNGISKLRHCVYWNKYGSRVYFSWKINAYSKKKRIIEQFNGHFLVIIINSKFFPFLKWCNVYYHLTLKKLRSLFWFLSLEHWICCLRNRARQPFLLIHKCISMPTPISFLHN